MANRKVWPAAQVGHLFANQSQDEARTSGDGNFYFRGRVAFSYRDNYALAVITDWKDETGARLVIMREDDYSATTGRHAGYVRQAFHNLPFRIVEAEPRNAYRASEYAMTADGAARILGERGAAAQEDARADLVSTLCESAARERDAALPLRSGARIARSYEKAIDRLANARIVARSAPTAKLRKAYAKQIDAVASTLPDLAPRADWPSQRYGTPEYEAAYEAMRTANADREAVAVAFQRDAVAEMRAAKKARALADAVTQARSLARDAKIAEHKAETDARGPLQKHEAAARQWETARAIATKQKAPLADRNKMRAQAERHKRAAERWRPLAALQATREAVAVLRGAVRSNLVAVLARRRHRRVHLVPSMLCAGRSVWQRMRHTNAFSNDHALGARNVETAARVLALAVDTTATDAAKVDAIKQERANGRYGNASTAEHAAHLVKVARGRGKYANEARALLQTAHRVAISATIDAATAGRRMRNDIAARLFFEHRDEARGALLQPLDFANASTVRGTLDRALRAAVIARQDGPLPHAMAADLERETEERRRVAGALADVSRLLGGTASYAVEEEAETVERMRKEAEAGRVLDAADVLPRIVQRASEYAGKVDDARDALTRHESPSNRETIARALVEIDRATVERARIAADAAALLESLAPAIAAAKADAIGHWRRTGEKPRGYNAVFSGDGGALFRVSGDEIVSTLGARVSVKAGRRLWALIRAVVASGKARTWEHGTGPHCGSFTVRSIAADGATVVGCHVISAREVHAFAEFMQWPPFGAETDADRDADARALVDA